MIRKIAEISEKKLPIIGVGGIMHAEDAIAHRKAGAQLVQIFTGFVYRGSRLINQIVDSY
jgi:dihydroorotate dehydrogenase